MPELCFTEKRYFDRVVEASGVDYWELRRVLALPPVHTIEGFIWNTHS
jgi:hypothetical protein